MSLDYATIKLVHQSAVALSVTGFFVRGVASFAGAGWVRSRAAKSLPHVVDTVLLLSALTLAWMLRLTPGNAPWLLAKIVGLVVYVGVGVVALRPGTVACGSCDCLGGGAGHRGLDRLRGHHEEPEGLPRGAPLALPLDRHQACRPSPSSPYAMPAATHQPVDVRAVLTEDLLRKFDTPGPRYTSYPTADRFAEKFGPADAARVLEARSHGSSSAPLSLYVHIPFCESLCYYCGCNKIITKHHERAAEYLEALDTELALVVESLGTGRPVSQLHFGGGSPTFLSDAELTRVMTALGTAFRACAGLRGLDRGRPSHRDARPTGALPQARIQPTQLRSPGLRSRGPEGGAPRSVVRDGEGTDEECPRSWATSPSMPTSSTGFPSRHPRASPERCSR